MYASFYEVFQDWFGVEWRVLGIFKVFGFFMVCAFTSAYFYVKHGFDQQAKKGYFTGEKATVLLGAAPNMVEVAFNAIIGFIMGYKVIFGLQNVETFVQSAEKIFFNSDGSLIGGIAFALFFGGYSYWEQKRNSLPIPVEKEIELFPSDKIPEIVFTAALWGILGAKVLASITEWDDFMRDPIGSLMSFAGLTYYGGLIMGAIGVFIYAWRKKIPIRPLIDVAAPALIMGYAIGRLGCHFAGDGDWGIVNTLAQPSWFIFPDWLWAYDYPNNVANAGVPIPGCEGDYCNVLPQGVWPTPVYEFIMGMSIFAFLHWMRSKLSIPGMVFAAYLIFNGLERFAIESIRVTDKFTFDFTQAQWIAMGLILAGIVLGTYFYKTPYEKPAQTIS